MTKLSYSSSEIKELRKAAKSIALSGEVLKITEELNIVRLTALCQSGSRKVEQIRNGKRQSRRTGRGYQTDRKIISKIEVRITPQLDNITDKHEQETRQGQGRSVVSKVNINNLIKVRCRNDPRDLFVKKCVVSSDDLPTTKHLTSDNIQLDVDMLAKCCIKEEIITQSKNSECEFKSLKYYYEMIAIEL
jgi:hypothetical protein